MLGFTQLYPRLGRYHFGRVAIAPESRGEGLGEQFLQRVMESVLKGQSLLAASAIDHNASLAQELHPEGYVLDDLGNTEEEKTLSQSIVLPFEASGFSLFVLEDNNAAIRCYQKLGFVAQPYLGTMPEGMKNCIYMVYESNDECF